MDLLKAMLIKLALKSQMQMLFNSKSVRVFQVWLQGGYIQSANSLGQWVLPGAQHHELVFEED